MSPWASGDTLDSTTLNLRGASPTTAVGYSTNSLRPESGNTVSLGTAILSANSLTGTFLGTSLISGQGQFDVRAFGAKGDGATDDGPAVRSAMAALSSYADGGVLYFSAGTYALGNDGAGFGLLLTDRRITLRGDGWRSVLRQRNGANVNQFIAHSFGTIWGTHIEHLMIDGNRSNQTGGTGNGVVFFSTIGSGSLTSEIADTGAICHIDDCFLVNWRSTALQTTAGASECKATNCVIIGSGQGIQGFTDGKIINCVVGTGDGNAFIVGPNTQLANCKAYEWGSVTSNSVGFTVTGNCNLTGCIAQQASSTSSNVGFLVQGRANQIFGQASGMNGPAVSLDSNASFNIVHCSTDSFLNVTPSSALSLIGTPTQNIVELAVNGATLLSGTDDGTNLITYQSRTFQGVNRLASKNTTASLGTSGNGISSELWVTVGLSVTTLNYRSGNTTYYFASSANTTV